MWAIPKGNNNVNNYNLTIFIFPIKYCHKRLCFILFVKWVIFLPACSSALEDDTIHIFPFGFFLTLRTVIIHCFQKCNY